jgi:hypothetical protein
MRNFNHTINVLVKAYLNDTLQHGDCAACAVGNIVADSSCLKMEKHDGELYWSKGWPTWQVVFSTSFSNQKIRPHNYINDAKAQIDSTGYTWQELARIEFAFESAAVGESDDDYMFNGLMAVVDVLAEIHNINLEEIKEAKALFVKTI